MSNKSYKDSTGKSKPLRKKDWDQLTQKEKETRLKALNVLRMMREGRSLTKTSKETNISAATVKRHVGNTIVKKSGKWKPRKSDKISRRMTIFTRGKMLNIKIADTKTASVIGRYHSAVGVFRQFADKSKIKEFDSVFVKDVFGDEFPLETRTKKIVQILERMEEPEVPIVYAT